MNVKVTYTCMKFGCYTVTCISIHNNKWTKLSQVEERKFPTHYVVKCQGHFSTPKTTRLFLRAVIRPSLVNIEFKILNLMFPRRDNGQTNARNIVIYKIFFITKIVIYCEKQNPSRHLG